MLLEPPAWLKTLYYICAISLMVGVMYLLVVQIATVKQENTINLNGYEISKPEALDQSMLEWLYVARRFAANHQYTNINYTCVNYSNDLYKLGTELGFRLKKKYGCVPKENGGCHEWLSMEVDIEPQSGAFVDYTHEYGRNQHEIN